MAAKKTVPKKSDPVPVRTPPKHGTFAPESGPSGDVTVDAESPGPAAEPEPDTSTPEAKAAAKDVEKAQKVADNTKSERSVKVRATRDGYMGNKIIAADTVFIIELGEGKTLPSWTEVVADDIPTTPVSHSSEAKEEVVDSAGIGHTPESIIKGK